MVCDCHQHVHCCVSSCKSNRLNPRHMHFLGWAFPPASAVHHHVIVKELGFEALHAASMHAWVICLCCIQTSLNLFAFPILVAKAHPAAHTAPDCMQVFLNKFFAEVWSKTQLLVPMVAPNLCLICWTESISVMVSMCGFGKWIFELFMKAQLQLTCLVVFGGNGHFIQFHINFRSSPSPTTAWWFLLCSIRNPIICEVGS